MNFRDLCAWNSDQKFESIEVGQLSKKSCVMVVWILAGIFYVSVGPSDILTSFDIRHFDIDINIDKS